MKNAKNILDTLMQSGRKDQKPNQDQNAGYESDQRNRFFYEFLSARMPAQSYVVIYGDIAPIIIDNVFDGSLNDFIKSHLMVFTLGYQPIPVFSDLNGVDKYFGNCPKEARLPKHSYILATDLPSDRVQQTVTDCNLPKHIKSAVEGFDFVNGEARGQISEDKIIANPNYNAHVVSHAI